MEENQQPSRLIDRRKYPRKPLCVKISAKEAGGSTLLYFYTKDLSLGGAFLKSNSFYWDPGTKIKLQFRLPHKKYAIDVKAEIVYKIEKTMTKKTNFIPGMGIKFLNLLPKDKIILKKYLDKF